MHELERSAFTGAFWEFVENGAPLILVLDFDHIGLETLCLRLGPGDEHAAVLDQEGGSCHCR